jgi:uncharacterized protein (DUF1501 family)
MKSSFALNQRRLFLKRSALATLGSASFLSLNTQFSLANAQVSASDDYKALVCVFLYGGNDAFNMLIPSANDSYATYAATRLAFARPKEDLLPLTPLNSVATDVGLAPELTDIQGLFQQQKLAFVANVGTLMAPTSQQDYLNNRVPLPPQLFSHNDQQNYVMSLQANQRQQGWASRMADLMQDVNSHDNLAMGISLSGDNLWQRGGLQAPYAMNAGGVSTYWHIQPTNTEQWAIKRNNAYNALLAQQQSHLFATEFAKTQRRSIDLGVELESVFNTTPAPSTAFDTNSRLGQMLKTVAHLIAGRERLGMTRQTFFVGIGDYDTHGDQVNRHPALMTELNNALSAFYHATVELGVSDKVTTFTASDFGRTLTSNGDGTDHGWGSHQMVMGDSVDGGKIFGTLPELAIGSIDDIGEGRIIPTTAVDQMAATLASWYGLSASQIADTFPTLSNFKVADLGFLNG